MVEKIFDPQYLLKKIFVWAESLVKNLGKKNWLSNYKTHLHLPKNHVNSKLKCALMFKNFCSLIEQST